MRTVLGFLILLAMFPFAASAQTPTAPSWPDIHFTTCPQIAESTAPGHLAWKSGQEEQADFQAGLKMKDNPREGAAALISFAEKYPDSDYREIALIGAEDMAGHAKDVEAQVRIAKMLLELPKAQALTRVAGYVTLDTVFSPHVLATDADKAQKIADLDRWTLCGMTALPSLIRPDKMQPEVFEKYRRYPESMLDRTRGFVAFLREDYRAAVPWLEKAAQLNSQDALTYLWLGRAKLISPSPDFNGGIFYLARWVELAPQVSGAFDYLKQSYVIVHGSDEGIENLRAIAKTNTTPPPGFNVLAPAVTNSSSATQVGTGHSRAAIVAAAALIGLLAYGAAKCPDCIAGAFGTESTTKVMIFGGPDHQTYLGCLSCSGNAPDSVFNETGRNGSRGFTESIWNHSGDYGSPYTQFSACNPYATDPPVIVDQSGNFYGRVTVNQYATDIGTGAQLYNWLASTVCAN